MSRETRLSGASNQGIDERAIANFVLDYGDELGVPITHMQLQKILYFCHGWYLAKEGSPLVRGRFEAWKDGPVLRSVYDEFKRAGRGAISYRATMLDLQTGQRRRAFAELSADLEEFIKTIAKLYMGFSAYDFSDMTHAANSPWYKIVFARDGRINPGQIISDDEIRDYFQSGRAPFPAT